MPNSVRINEAIRVPEVRLIGIDEENVGVVSISEALKRAEDAGTDLIEISPKANPPVAKIMDYGKFVYEQKKKQKEIKTNSSATETKVAQVKMGTGEDDRNRKARSIAKWLSEGHRVKIDLFLPGRYKYMEFAFLKSKLEAFLAIIPESFKIADEIKKSPKGLSVTVEFDKSKKQKDENK